MMLGKLVSSIIFAGAPAIAVAANAIGAPEIAGPVYSGAIVAARAFAPIVVPSVHVGPARPCASVVMVSDVDALPAPTRMDPPPCVTVNNTGTPATALPDASVILTRGALATASPATALWPFPANSAICFATPATNCVGASTELTPGDENDSVRAPIDPLTTRLVKVASPAVLVSAVSVPPRVPPPFNETVIGTLAVAIALPKASAS